MSKNNRSRIDFTSGGEVKNLLTVEPLSSSQHMKENGVYLEHYQHMPGEVSEHYPKQHLILINTQVSDSTQYEQTIDGRLQSDPLMVGHVVVIPADVQNHARWHTKHSYILLSIDPATFSHRALELAGSDRFDLIPRFAHPDPLLYQIGLALKTEANSEQLNGQFYFDSLTTTFIAHLLHHYADKVPEPQRHVSGLSKQRIQRAVDYIHSNLNLDLSLAELSEVVCISPSYFAMSFKETTGVSPHQYIIRCRIDRAKQLLKDSDLSISRIAQDLGFSHQSHLHYHFKQAVGVTPRTFQKNSKNLI